MARTRADLVAVAVFAGVAALIVVFVPQVVVRAVFALPLVFILPGYAITAALFAVDRLDGARLILLTVGLSLSAAILCALVLHLTVGLHPASWSAALVAVTWGGSVVAGRRPDAGPVMRRRLTGVRMVDVAVVLIAVLVAIGAVAFARSPLPAKKAQGYTTLWLEPRGSASAPRVMVGVMSDELRRYTYRLDVRAGSEVLYRRYLTLEPGRRWEGAFSLARVLVLAETRIEARLYRGDRPPQLYRLVRLRAGTFSVSS